MKWMELAWADLGVHETAGSGATPEIVAYFRDAGRADVTSDEVAWCAAFVAAELARAGIANPIAKPERLLAISYKTIGTALPKDGPRVGCIAVVRRPGGHHVAFVSGYTATHLKLLGGNQSNAVTEQLWPRADIVALRWPMPPATPGELDKLGSATTQLAKRQQKDAGKATTIGTSGPVVPPHVPHPPPAAPSLPQPGEIAGKVSEVQTAIDTLQTFAGFVQTKWPWVAAGIAAYYGGRLLYTGWLIRQARTADHNSGANTGRGEPLPDVEETPLQRASGQQETPA